MAAMGSGKKRCPTPWKTCYALLEDAQRAARMTRRSNVKSGVGGDVRVYRCDCGWLHLTKMTKHQHKYKHDPGYRSEVNRRSRINDEVDYWSRRLGVDDDLQP